MITADDTTDNTLDIYDPTNPNFVNPNDVLLMHPDDTAARIASCRVDVIQATMLRTVKVQIVNLNANLASNYQTFFAAWLANWTNGRITDKSTAPVPPMAYVVGYYDDPTSTPGTIKWPYPVAGTTPVCAQPAIPDLPKPYVPPDPNAPPPGILGQKVNAAFDSFPVGFQATRADGSVWQKFTDQTPFGQATWWECVKGAN
jgi:hypothetical protein